LPIRAHKIMLDKDVADLYQVTTEVMFQLTHYIKIFLCKKTKGLESQLVAKKA